MLLEVVSWVKNARSPPKGGRSLLSIWNNMAKKIIEEEWRKDCTHQVWTREFPLEIVGYSKESKLAWMFCRQCDQNFWMEFEMLV